MHRLTPRSVKSQSKFVHQDRVTSESLSNEFMKLAFSLAFITVVFSLLTACNPLVPTKPSNPGKCAPADYDCKEQPYLS